MVPWETLPRNDLLSHQAHRALPHSCSCFSLGNLSFEWLIISFLGPEPEMPARGWGRCWGPSLSLCREYSSQQALRAQPQVKKNTFSISAKIFDH